MKKHECFPKNTLEGMNDWLSEIDWQWVAKVRLGADFPSSYFLLRWWLRSLEDYREFSDLYFFAVLGDTDEDDSGRICCFVLITGVYPNSKKMRRVLVRKWKKYGQDATVSRFKRPDSACALNTLVESPESVISCNVPNDAVGSKYLKSGSRW